MCIFLILISPLPLLHTSQLLSSWWSNIPLFSTVILKIPFSHYTQDSLSWAAKRFFVGFFFLLNCKSCVSLKKTEKKLIKHREHATQRYLTLKLHLGPFQISVSHSPEKAISLSCHHISFLSAYCRPDRYSSFSSSFSSVRTLARKQVFSCESGSV